MLGSLTALMDFSDKAMASPSSACLGEVPGMVMKSIRQQDREEEEAEGNAAKMLLSVGPDAWAERKLAGSASLAGAGEGNKDAREMSLQGLS